MKDPYKPMSLEDMEKYITWFLKRRKGIPINDYEDVRQECFMNLWAKRGKYNPERAKFSTFAFYVCRESVCKYMNKLVRKVDREIYLADIDEKYTTYTNIDQLLVDYRLDGHTQLLEDQSVEI